MIDFHMASPALQPLGVYKTRRRKRQWAGGRAIHARTEHVVARDRLPAQRHRRMRVALRWDRNASRRVCEMHDYVTAMLSLAICETLDSWGLQGPPEASRGPPGPPGTSRSFLVPPGASRGFLGPPRASRGLPSPLGTSRTLLGPPGPS